VPFKVWAVGEEVLAADFNSFLQQQVVATFPNTAARDAAIPAPSVGQLCYVTAVGLLMYEGTAWVSVRGGQTLQTQIANGQTVGPSVELTLATLNIPAKPQPYTLELCQQSNCYATVSGDTILMRLRVGGVQVALLENRFSGTNIRANVGQSTSRLTPVAANTAVVATLTAQGSASTGNFAFGNPQESYLTARLTY
jgi:hypothetical protein